MYSSKSFTVLGVTDANREETLGLAREHSLNFPLLVGAEATRESYGIDMVRGSIFYLVDSESRIVADGLGDLEEALAEAFAQGGTAE